ncbi:MAG: hypothetical protein K5746_10910 [Clostridiales bacterium]|nr:hypothetical protein [Clostridiales bacterium]
MDHFKEDIVGRGNPSLYNALYVLAWALLALLGVHAFVLLQMLIMQFSLPALAMFLANAGLAVLLYFGKDELKAEYEYTFTNGTLDFAKVLRGARRKELGSMNVANVEACGHVTDPSFARFRSMNSVRTRNWFLNRDGNLFYFYYTKDGQKNMIVLEPSEEMVTMIRVYLPAGVYRG